MDDIFERLAQFGSAILSDSMGEVHRAFKDVARATYASGSRHYRDSDVVAKVAEILGKAARDIESAVRDASEKGKSTKTSSDL